MQLDHPRARRRPTSSSVPMEASQEGRAASAFLAQPLPHTTSSAFVPPAAYKAGRRSKRVCGEGTHEEQGVRDEEGVKGGKRKRTKSEKARNALRDLEDEEVERLLLLDVLDSDSGRDEPTATTSSAAPKVRSSCAPDRVSNGTSASNSSPSAFTGPSLPKLTFYSSPTNTSSRGNSYFWHPDRKRLYSFATDSHIYQPSFESLDFTTSRLSGNVLPSDLAQDNTFIRQQRCVPPCRYDSNTKIKPVRLREHLAHCKDRQAFFAARGEVDALARLCELQIGARR